MFSALSHFCCCFISCSERARQTGRRADSNSILKLSFAALPLQQKQKKGKKDPGALSSPGYVIFYPVLYTALLPDYATLHTITATVDYYASTAPPHVHNNDKINNGQTPPRNRPPHRRLPYKTHRRGLTPPSLQNLRNSGRRTPLPHHLLPPLLPKPLPAPRDLPASALGPQHSRARSRPATHSGLDLGAFRPAFGGRGYRHLQQHEEDTGGVPVAHVPCRSVLQIANFWGLCEYAERGSEGASAAAGCIDEGE